MLLLLFLLLLVLPPALLRRLLRTFALKMTAESAAAAYDCLLLLANAGSRPLRDMRSMLEPLLLRLGRLCWRKELRVSAVLPAAGFAVLAAAAGVLFCAAVLLCGVVLLLRVFLRGVTNAAAFACITVAHNRIVTL
jgi:hypothetical protein